PSGLLLVVLMLALGHVSVGVDARGVLGGVVLLQALEARLKNLAQPMGGSLCLPAALIALMRHLLRLQSGLGDRSGDAGAKNAHESHPRSLTQPFCGHVQPPPHVVSANPAKILRSRPAGRKVKL